MSNEELVCPICGEVTSSYMGNYRRDRLCRAHAKDLKNGIIEIDSDGLFINSISGEILNADYEDNSSVADGTCVVCGAECKKGHHQCRDCYYETRDYMDGIDGNSSVRDLRDWYYNLKDYIGECDICGKNCDKSHYEMFYPVRYSNERFDVTPLLTYIANYEIFPSQTNKPIIPIDDQFVVQKALLNKSTDWSYEKEWRLMSLGRTQELRKYLSLKPTAIYLGVEIRDINKKILMTLAKEKNIKTYQMFIDTESPEFKMEYTEIE